MADSVAVYSASADQYESTYAERFGDIVKEFADSLPRPSLILDAGCGPGRDLARLRQHGHVARGVDLNPVFVAKANAIAPTLLADLREIGRHFPERFFDGVLANASLVHLRTEEARDVLAQLAGLLRVGGKLFACLKSTGHTGWLDEHDGRRWYTVWEPNTLSDAVCEAGFAIEKVKPGPFVEVWATRNG